ncbi:MAG: response regulator, partial [Pseudomonadota bacterium]|nr:response regulator [Pseudomonadota bacterium]
YAVAPKIIINVDHEEDAAEALRFTIEEGGYEVVTATDIEDATAKAAEGKFDATVLDLPMTELSRLEVAKKLEADPLTALPIVLLTELEEEIVRKQFTGYDQFVSKEADLEELLKQLALAIDTVARVH